MFNNHQMAVAPMTARSFTSRLLSGGFTALCFTLVLAASNAQAATPAANSVISNQATANYLDSGNTPQTATSNQVTTVVAQVGSYTLTSDNTKIAAPGTTVYMPHTLTNTGNGTDTFNITLPTTFDSTNLNSVAVYADTNADGLPDGSALCTVGGTPACTGTNVPTGPLASGGKYDFIVALAVKATAANGAITPEVVTAVPVGAVPYSYAPATLSNTDNLTVNNTNPVFAVTKSIVGQTSGAIGSNVLYKLSYTNSGNAAGPLYIKDIIGQSVAGDDTTSYSYVGSAVWSDGAAALTDAAHGDPAGIDYQAVTAGSGATAVTTIEAVVANVAANASGYITFTVHVDAGAPLGTSETTNIATYARSNDGTSDCTTLPCTPSGTLTPTNQSPFDVIGTYAVIANDNGTASANVQDGTVAGDNLVGPLTAVAPSTVVSFDNYIWNTGDSPDTFNLAFNGIGATTENPFPVGTTFKFFQNDGVTPLLSSDTDGIPDTGAIAVAGFYKVVVQATIPANACSVGDCSLTNLTEEIIVTSKGDPTKSNKVYDQLAKVTPPGVDLTNVGVLGAGVGSTASPAITTQMVAPGNIAYFNLNVTNTGSAIDNYNLNYHVIDSTGADLATASAFAAGTLPSGWSVTIHTNTAGTGVCSASTLGPVVSNTGAIAAAAEANFCAAVSTPATGATALAGTYRTYFQVTSNATGASDIKLDAVALSPQNVLTLTPNGAGQIQPGGTILYPHTLLNGGNNTCGGNFTFNVTNNGSATGWSYVLYIDNNANGTVEASDTVIGGGINATDTLTTTMSALAAGTEVKLLVKVQAPSGASSGVNDTINVTATDTTLSCGTTAPIQDVTTVLAGQIRLDKTQALSTWNGTSCDTAGAYSGSGTVLSQKPGDCIWYRVLATNQGDAAVTDVVINDATPTFTSYAGSGTCTNVSGMGAVAAASLTGTGTAAVGSVGSIGCATWTTVPAAGVVQLDFAVRINP